VWRDSLGLVDPGGCALAAERGSILVVPAHPGHREIEAVLVAALRHKIEELIGTVDHVDASRVAGIRVEHLATLILAEDADALLIRHVDRSNRIVVVCLTFGDLFGRK
jgi:hypothetical protein